MRTLDAELPVKRGCRGVEAMEFRLKRRGLESLPQSSRKPDEYPQKEASSLLKHGILRIRVPPVPAVHDAVTSVNTRIEIIDHNA